MKNKHKGGKKLPLFYAVVSCKVMLRHPLIKLTVYSLT